MDDLRPKANAPVRGALDVGPGDYVKVGSHWERVQDNTAYGAARVPRDWTVRTERGAVGAWGINRYAKAEDMERRDG